MNGLEGPTFTTIKIRKIFQRNYYDHIIRHGKSLKKIRHYIRYNHLKYDKDKKNHKNR